jgi:dTDP-4-dehydrorhamnose reductase
MKVIVTGAGGQLGRVLPAALGGHDVTAFERSHLDITDLGAVREALRALRPDLIVNAAAYNAVDQAETDRDAAFRGNVLGPRNLAVATAESGAVILHVSSDYVFDGEAARPYDEYDLPNPRSAYGQSKLAGEEAVRSENTRHYVVRTAWLYAREGRNFPRTILEMAARGPVRVVDDQRGSPTYAPHLAAGIARLVATGAFGTWHLAGSGEATWFELTDTLFRLRNVRAELRPATTADLARPAPRPRYSVLTSVQEPRIRLPAWEQGLREFSADL